MFPNVLHIVLLVGSLGFDKSASNSRFRPELPAGFARNYGLLDWGLLHDGLVFAGP